MVFDLGHLEIFTELNRTNSSYTLKHENILTLFDHWLTNFNQWLTTFSRFATDFHILDNLENFAHLN